GRPTTPTSCTCKPGLQSPSIRWKIANSPLGSISSTASWNLSLISYVRGPSFGSEPYAMLQQPRCWITKETLNRDQPPRSVGVQDTTEDGIPLRCPFNSGTRVLEDR